jgi:anti-anti-sigma regulatory factor
MQVRERRLTTAELNRERLQPFRPFGDGTIFNVAGFVEDGIDGVVVLDVDTLAGNCGTLATRLRSLIEEGERTIVINLSWVTSWDETGLGELVRAYTIVVRGGGRLELTNAPHTFREWVASLKFMSMNRRVPRHFNTLAILSAAANVEP